MEDRSQYHDSFTLQRVYPSSMADVWSAWSSREKKAEWLGNSALEMDFRPGGMERGTFRDAMGEHVNETRYFEIDEARRIVLAYSMAVDGRVHTVSLTTVVFTDANPGTRLLYTEQMCIIPPSDSREGREHGWNVLLDALGSHLAGIRENSR
jgi:uncharacterized protein YndB with AHSA1/START domain